MKQVYFKLLIEAINNDDNNFVRSYYLDIDTLTKLLYSVKISKNMFKELYREICVIYTSNLFQERNFLEKDELLIWGHNYREFQIYNMDNGYDIVS